MPVTRAMRKKAADAETEPKPKETLFKTKAKPEKVITEKKEPKRKLKKEEKENHELEHEEAPQEPKPESKKAGPATKTRRQKYTPSFSIFSPPSASKTPTPARKQMPVIPSSPSTASPRAKKARANPWVSSKHVEEEPVVETALPPRIKRKPDVYSPPIMTARKPPKVPVSVVPSSKPGSVAGSSRGVATVSRPPPAPPVGMTPSVKKIPSTFTPAATTEKTPSVVIAASSLVTPTAPVAVRAIPLAAVPPVVTAPSVVAVPAVVPSPSVVIAPPVVPAPAVVTTLPVVNASPDVTDTTVEVEADAPVVTAKTNAIRQEEPSVKPNKKDSRTKSVILEDDMPDSVSMAGSRPQRTRSKGHPSTTKVTVKTPLRTRKSGSGRKPKSGVKHRSAVKPKPTPSSKVFNRTLTPAEFEKKERNHRQLRNLAKKFGSDGTWENKIVQITTKTTNMICDSHQFLKNMFAETMRNWTENKSNPQRAIMKTPMMRNLRSRLVALDAAQKSVSVLGSLAEVSSDELSAKDRLSKFKFAPAKTIVSNLKKRARSNTPDSPAGFRHQIPQNFDFREKVNAKANKPPQKRLAFDDPSPSSFIVSQAIEAFEKLALKSLESPKTSVSALKVLPKKLDLGADVFKIPELPKESTPRKKIESPRKTEDVYLSPPETRVSGSKLDTRMGRGSSDRPSLPQIHVRSMLEICEDPNVSLEMDFAGGDEQDNNSTFSMQSALDHTSPALFPPTDEIIEVDDGRKSTLNIKPGTDLTFEIDSGAKTSFKKYSDSEKHLSAGSATFNVISEPNTVTPDPMDLLENITFDMSCGPPAPELTIGNATFNIGSATFTTGPNPNATYVASVASPKVPSQTTAAADKTFAVPMTIKKPFIIPTHDSSDEDEESFMSCHNETLNESVDNILLTPKGASNLTREINIKSEHGIGNKTFQISGSVQPGNNPNQTYVAQPRNSLTNSILNALTEQQICETLDPMVDPNSSMEMSLSESHVSTYDITIYEDLDEENAHRAKKVLPGWAADRKFLMEQLYSLNPSFLTSGREVDSHVFPGMPKFKLFPGSTAPRRKP